MFRPSADTAISRKSVSAPVRFLLDQDRIHGRVLNFGEGRAWLDTAAMNAESYDPYFSPDFPQGHFDTIYCGYVLNTLPPDDRADALNDLANCCDPDTTVWVAVRSDKVSGEPFEDGVLTSRDTFQKSYTIDELKHDLKFAFRSYKIKSHGHYLLAECRI